MLAKAWRPVDAAFRLVIVEELPIHLWAHVASYRTSLTLDDLCANGCSTSGHAHIVATHAVKIIRHLLIGGGLCWSRDVVDRSLIRPIATQ